MLIEKSFMVFFLFFFIRKERWCIISSAIWRCGIRLLGKCLTLAQPRSGGKNGGGSHHRHAMLIWTSELYFRSLNNIVAIDSSIPTRPPKIAKRQKKLWVWSKENNVRGYGNGFYNGSSSKRHVECSPAIAKKSEKYHVISEIELKLMISEARNGRGRSKEFTNWIKLLSCACFFLFLAQLHSSVPYFFFEQRIYALFFARKRLICRRIFLSLQFTYSTLL